MSILSCWPAAILAVAAVSNAEIEAIPMAVHPLIAKNSEAVTGRSLAGGRERRDLCETRQGTVAGRRAATTARLKAVAAESARKG